MELNDRSIEILYKAIENNAQIIQIRSLCGVTISIGNFEINLNQVSPREKADWEYGIQELVSYGLIKSMGYKNEIFEVTKLGFDYYDNNIDLVVTPSNTLKNIEIGSVINDDKNNVYKVIEYISKGGFGNVFKIQRLKDKKIFALKTIVSDDALNSFKNEIKIALSINHKNVVKYYYINIDDYKDYPPYIIMEYIEGITLEEYIQQNDKMLDDKLLTNLFNQLIEGMIAININIVHRDIKTKNIMITENDIIKISDFGISKWKEESTRENTFKGIGSKEYVAPEGWKFEKNTIQMDVYSMGIVFYELATKKYPYVISNNTFESYRQAHLSQAPINPIDYNENLNINLCTMILKMLEKETTKRFLNFTEIKSFIDDMPKDGTSNIVKELISKRIKLDLQNKEKEMKQNIKNTEEMESFQILTHSFKNNIIIPLEKIIDQFNYSYTEGNLKLENIHSNNNAILYNLTSIDNESTNIEFKINKDNSLLLKEKTILGFGRVYQGNNTGINIYIIENEDNIYGEWYYSITKNSPLSTKQNPEPICFTFDELPNEIRNFKAMHIYQTEIFKLTNIEDLIPYIKFCNI